jgi:lysophospholipase L1-like esterase
MHYVLTHLAVITGLVVAAAAASAQARGVRASGPVPPKMLFVGDSITAGGGATVASSGGFVALLAARFPEIEMANLGCNGATVRDWTTVQPQAPHCVFGSAWETLAQPELPAHITHVMLGTNDAVGFLEPVVAGARWVSPEEYEFRLRTLVERSPGLVLLSSPPRVPLSPTGRRDERLQAYRGIVLYIVEDYWYVELGGDFYWILDPSSDLDGVHPNDAGHAKMADELERRILAVLPRGALSPCRNSVACERFEFLPRYRHTRTTTSHRGEGGRSPAAR